MNREIKFRAWDKEYNVMRSFSNHKEGILYAYGEFKVSSGWDSYDSPTFEHDTAKHFEIMQFTGLQDSKGVDIYESDIVYIAGTGNCKVEWDNCLSSFIFDNKRAGYSYQDVIEDVERVVGNIHQNPELLDE